MGAAPRLEAAQDRPAGHIVSRSEALKGVLPEVRPSISEVESDGRAHSLRKLLLEHDGPPLPAEVARSVVRRHEAFWTLQDGLIEDLASDRIDRRQYLNTFKHEVAKLAEDDQHILGQSAYAAIFGSHPADAAALIDDDVFLAGEPDGDLEFEVERRGPMPR